MLAGMALSRFFAPPRPSVTRSRHGLAVVRTVTALVLATHPLYALTHPAYREHLGGDVGVTAVTLFAVLQLGLALALLVPAAVRAACVGNAVLLAGNIAFFQGPAWYALGGGSEEGHPGIELDVLLIVYLASIFVADPRRRAGPLLSPALAVAFPACIAAFNVSTHALHPFVTWDLEGMRDFGAGMEHRGFPCGLVLVWSAMVTQILATAGILSRRLVVPGCAAHMSILGLGVCITHWGRWFIQGPGEGGMEYSVLLLTAFSVGIWTSGPAGRHGAAADPLPAEAAPHRARAPA